MKYNIMEFFTFEETKEFEFREVCGFTFAFEKNIVIFGDEIASGEIKPIAIIYEENDEYYLAPLDEVSDIEAIIKKYVETCM